MKYTVMPCIYDYNTNKQIIEDLIKEYPFLNIQLIGRTAVGRSIFSLSVGNNKNSVIYIGSVRGSDGLSGLMLLLFIERLCHSVKYNHTMASVSIRRALSLSGVAVIPCLNPDGREIFLYGPKGAKSMGSFVSSFYNEKTPLWDGNAAGVGINHNFLFRDKIRDGCDSAFYCGDYPESEAETRALTRLCRLKKYRMCMELSSGEDEIIYRSDEGEPANSQMMAKILSSTCGIPTSPDKTSPSHGIMNWFIKEFQRPAFTLLTKDDISELYKIYGRLEEALTVFSLL